MLLFRKFTMILLLASLLSASCSGNRTHYAPKESPNLKIAAAKKKEQGKKVIVVLVDSLMPKTLEEELRTSKLPALQYLLDQGQYYNNVVSSFPTMSVTIDSTLFTGTYTDQHHVPGLTWYSKKEDRVISYGTGLKEVLKLGAANIAKDALIHLNGMHLSPNVTTIYEDLANKRISSGSINGLIYRGSSSHELDVPPWFASLLDIQGKMFVKAPDFFTLGVLASPFKEQLLLPDSIFHKNGFNDEYAIKTAIHLVKTNQLPDFLYVYLPDLDQKIHKKGPDKRYDLQSLDKKIGSLLDSFGSKEKALQDVVFVVLGDSGMTSILPDEQNPVIDLPDHLSPYRVYGKDDSDIAGSDIIIAVNETMAYVYRKHAQEPLSEIAGYLLNDDRIDFVAWQEKDWVYVTQSGTGKHLQFKNEGKLRDIYGQSFDIKGDHTVLDLQVSTAAIKYGYYPDALKRLSTAFSSHEGEYLIVTAKPGYELADKQSPLHKGGGGHGALGKQESLVPLIISGTNKVPETLRIVDLKKYLLSLFET